MRKVLARRGSKIWFVGCYRCLLYSARRDSDSRNFTPGNPLRNKTLLEISLQLNII